MEINEVIKAFSMVLNQYSYHDEDDDSDNNSSYYLVITYYLPGTVQKPYEVAALIPTSDE